VRTAFARTGVLLTLLCAVAACGTSQISSELTSEALRTSGKSVLVISVRLVSKTMSTNCDMVQVIRAGDGRKVDVRLATHLVPEPSEVSGSVELDPGTYTVTTALCSRPNVKFVVEPADARGLATINIGPGEVVDGGTLIIIEMFQPVLTQYLGHSQFYAIVRPGSGQASAALNRDLAGRVTRRPMTAINPPPPDALARMCEFHRQQARGGLFSSGAEESPLCEIIGQRSAGPDARKPR
jgi:hypothetical protein